MKARLPYIPTRKDFIQQGNNSFEPFRVVVVLLLRSGSEKIFFSWLSSLGLDPAIQLGQNE
jgi:hypothetical protein